MKKTLLLGFVILFVGVAFGPNLAKAQGGSFLISPTEVSVKKGQTFNINVSVNSGDVNVYTSKLDMSFSSSILEVKSFTFESGLLQLSQPGYDLIDNNSGKLIKTAGYSGGFIGKKSFGTITFKAKEAGSATISIGQESQILDKESKNIFSGVSSSSLISVMPEPTPTVVKKTSQVVGVVKSAQNTKDVQPEMKEGDTVENSPSPSVEPNTDDQSRDVESQGRSGWTTALLVVVALVVVIGGYLFTNRRK